MESSHPTYCCKPRTDRLISSRASHFNPIFGGMRKTQLMPEFQITQEYLGFSNHLVFLAQMWREVLDSDTYAKGQGSTVTKIVDGSLNQDRLQQRLTGMAGVANTGRVRNWTGHHFAQAKLVCLRPTGLESRPPFPANCE